MICKLCGSNNVNILCDRPLRDGGIGNYTKESVKVFQCKHCDVIWHDDYGNDIEEYYESKSYRIAVNGDFKVEDIYKSHDLRIIEKFEQTGTHIFRGKVVADVGCAVGAFLDFVNGVADTVIGIEPSELFREVLAEKGYPTYAYVQEAVVDYKNKIDVITSFDVIEHVDDPESFLKGIYDLLSEDGCSIIGTPTDAPIMRELLGESYEKQILFNTPHIWIFSEKNLKMLAEKCGFKNIEVKYYQRYGIDNLLGWLMRNKPQSDYNASFVTNTLKNVFKGQCEDNKLADFIVLHIKK